jgi:hypothetical protein
MTTSLPVSGSARTPREGEDIGLQHTCFEPAVHRHRLDRAGPGVGCPSHLVGGRDRLVGRVVDPAEIVSWVETHWLFCLIVGPEVLFFPCLLVYWLVLGTFCAVYRVSQGEWPDLDG